MKKLAYVAATAAGLMVAATIGTVQAKDINFGCFLPLTGPLAQYGKNMQNGMELALEDINSSGKISGGKVTVACEDDQNRADDGINIARKFVENDDLVAAIGSWGSTVTMAAGPIFNKAKMVAITPISSHPGVTKIGPYIFRQSIIQPVEGKHNAAYLKDLGVKKLAIIGLPNDYGKANVHFSKTNFKALGGEVVFEEFIRPDAQDFRQVIQKAVRNKPDMIYLGMFAPQASLIVKQARQLGIKTPFYGAAALSSQHFPRLSGEAANGVRLQLVFHSSISPQMAAYFKRYGKRYGRQPDSFAVNAYITSSMLFGIAAKQYPNISRESIREGLEAVRSIDTIAGKLVYDPKSREWAFPFRKGLIKDGKFTVVD